MWFERLKGIRIFEFMAKNLVPLYFNHNIYFRFWQILIIKNVNFLN